MKRHHASLTPKSRGFNSLIAHLTIPQKKRCSITNIIQAVLKNGAIYLLEPLPSNWTEGSELAVQLVVIATDFTASSLGLAHERTPGHSEKLRPVMRS